MLQSVLQRAQSAKKNLSTQHVSDAAIGFAAVSVVHYLGSALLPCSGDGSIRAAQHDAQIPLHYDLFGNPGLFVPRAGLVFYPAMSCALAFVVKLQKPQQDLAPVIILATIALLDVCQFYAVRISNGQSRKMPSLLTASMVCGIVGISALSVV